MWIVANGHEWLKRQLTLAGVGFQALDNGLQSVDDPGLARRLAAQLSAGHLRAGIDRWLSWLPSPLIPADRQAGFGYDFSIRQLEISDTAVFDAPRRGRAWFEATIRDHLDLGRPEQGRWWSTAPCAPRAGGPPRAGSRPRSSGPTSTPSSRSSTSPPRPSAT